MGAGLARLLIYALLLFLAVNCITVDFKWPEQLVLGILTIALALAIHGIADSELITLSHVCFHAGYREVCLLAVFFGL